MEKIRTLAYHLLVVLADAVTYGVAPAVTWDLASSVALYHHLCTFHEVDYRLDRSQNACLSLPTVFEYFQEYRCMAFAQLLYNLLETLSVFGGMDNKLKKLVHLQILKHTLFLYRDSFMREKAHFIIGAGV